MKIRLSDHFSYSKLLRFTLPSMGMMIFTSLYSMVDGFFISNFVGITPFAAINLIFPVIQVLSGVGFMFGAGGSALVSATLGAGQRERANRIFSLITYVAMAVGVILALIGIPLLEPLSLLLGADRAMLPYCITYGRILLLALPAFMMQTMLQNFLITAEKPTVAFAITLAAGVSNMVLDALFIAVLHWGVVGAALATTLAQVVGGAVPLIYFFRKNTSLLRLGRTRFEGGPLLHCCGNGFSELVTNISMSVVAILYNFQLMRLAGENGVAAYGAVMYVSFIFVSLFLGYSIGVAPVVVFHYGAEHHDELKSLRKKSNMLILIASAILAVVAFSLARPLARVFVGNDEALLDLTGTAFRFYALGVLFSGFNIFGSAFFTALNNGLVSAAISFLRTIVFQIAGVLLLPIFFDLRGVWYSLPTAELLATAITFVFYRLMRKNYHY